MYHNALSLIRLEYLDISMIRSSRLKTFLRNYCIGPDRGVPTDNRLFITAASIINDQEILEILPLLARGGDDA